MQTANSVSPVLQAVDADNAGHVFTTGRQVRLTILSVSFLIPLFGGPVLAAEGIANLSGNTIFTELTPLLAVPAIVLGVLLFVAGFVATQFAPQWFFLRSYEPLIRQRIAERTNALVDPNDPEAIFVKWTPRDQWHKVKLDDAADVGLLKIDRTNRRLLFEGDLFRHVVPADQIADCVTEFGGSSTMPFTLVVVQLDDDADHDLTELCYEHNQLRGRFSRRHGSRAARTLRDRICELFPQILR